MNVRILLLCFLCLLAGCVGSNEVTNEDLLEYEVKQTFDETMEDEFIFQLVSGKEEYEQGEEVELYGEIVYTGEEGVTIAHASSAVLFKIKEQVRGYELPFAVQEIGVETDLTAGDPYREKYLKQGVFSFERDEEKYAEFIEDFKRRRDFPPGYYTVIATTAFNDGVKQRELEAAVDFKVWAAKEEE